MSELCDKGWMVIEDRSSPGYRTGVDNFIKFAYNNRIRDTPFCICPCRRCRHRKSLSFARVRHDLLVNGILSTYVIWSLHGETSTHTQRSAYVAQGNVEHTVVEEETLEKEIVEESRGDDGCRLNEFVDKTFGVYEGLNEDVSVGDSEHTFIQNTPSPEKGSTSFTGVQKGHVQEKEVSASVGTVESTNRVQSGQVGLLNNMGKVVASGVIVGGGVVHGRKVKKNERKVFIEEVFEQKVLIWDGPQGDNWVYLSQVPVPTWLVWSEERLRPSEE